MTRVIQPTIILLFFILGVSCNIWDNIYSQTYASSPIILEQSLNLDFQIPQYSLTGNFDYNQELAHPLGANFREVVGIVRYQPAKLPALSLQLKYINAVHGIDTIGTLYGGDIFQTSNGLLATNEFDNFVGQGTAYRTNYIEFMASYQFWHNMYADFNVSHRSVNSDIDDQDRSTTWIGIGFRMNMAFKSMAY